MPSNDVDRYLHKVLGEYGHHIQASGAHNRNAHYPNPNLANEILPMFDKRWAAGPGQHTTDIYPFTKEAFKLASRLLTERFPLMWFSHLTFGERRRGRSGVHIVPTSYSTSIEAVEKVRQNIQHVGEVITFMFQPPGYRDSSHHGVTCRLKEDQPFYQEIRSTDWPRISRHARMGNAQPLVVMNNDFQEYFRSSVSSSNQDEAYRVLFLFAITLVHEFCHAYEFWLTRDYNEPFWTKSENTAELGWSWEKIVIGYGLQHYGASGARHFKVPFLYTSNVKEYHSTSERERVLKRLTGSYRDDAPFTRADSKGRIAAPPLLNAIDIHRSSFHLEDNSRAHSCICAVQVVPMTWVVNWFREESWVHWTRYWRQQNQYSRPTLGNAFTLLYERNGRHTCTLRPLYPAFPVDRDILACRARGDKSR